MDLLALFKIYLFFGTVAYIAFIFWLFRKPGKLSLFHRKAKLPKADEDEVTKVKDQ